MHILLMKSQVTCWWCVCFVCSDGAMRRCYQLLKVSYCGQPLKRKANCMNWSPTERT